MGYKKSFIMMIWLTQSVAAFAQEKDSPTPQWRPAYHFSPLKNWTNDPNGLIYMNGLYHLYYQHNPFENKWGHMSWGHATSKDLVRWNHLPVAMAEKITTDTTTMIFSGSAVLDKNNTSGFGRKGTAPVVAIFTTDQPKQKKQAQNVSYSNNGGLTFTPYTGNPVLDLGKKDFRDPNVFWYEPTQQWIMTVAMVDEHMVGIYGSKDLKQWTKLSDFGPAGSIRNGWECPSLLPLAVEGSTSQTKWVMFISLFGDHGPEMQYFIGDFDGRTFINEKQQPRIKVDYGDAYYAAIAWRDAPENRKILLGWLINGKKETYPWKGQMSIPHDLSLKTSGQGLVLMQRPSQVVQRAISIYAKGRTLSKRNLPVNGSLKLVKDGTFNHNANWITAEFKLENAKKLGFLIAVQDGSSKGITVGYDVMKEELYVDCSATERGIKDDANLIMRAPLKAINGVVRMQILLDGSSLEVFGNDGEEVISTMVYPANGANGTIAFAEGSATLTALQMWDLSNKP